MINTNHLLMRLMSVALAIALCPALVTFCAQRPLWAAAMFASQDQIKAPATPIKIQLNLDDMGTSADTSMLNQKLREIFQIRLEQHAYKIGFERRTDLREDDRIEKTVFVKADRSITLEQVTKLIKAVEDAGADPVALPIYSNGKTNKNCLTCALKDRTVMKPSPLVLLVRITPPNTRPSLDAYGLRSISDLLISDGIPIVLSRVAGGEPLVITLPKDGEFNFGEKRIEKAALENEILDRIKAKPGAEKVVAIKCSPDITYGSLEDIYQAAFAAGAKRVMLDTTLSATREPNSMKSSTEQEIRAALCEIDKRDYAAAQKRLEGVLQADPKNLYAQKVLLGSLAQQIKPGDRSAENIVVIRKAIEAYQQAMKNAQFTSEEKGRIDHYLLLFYRQISEEELMNEVQRRASDSSRTAKDRADLYAVLASKAWDCSYRITSTQSALEKSQIEAAKACVASGLNYANQAIILYGENESAWRWKANLLKEASTLAGIEANQTQKVSLQRQSDDALKRADELSAQRRAEEEKEWARQDEEGKKNDSYSKRPTNQPDDSDQISKELTDYRAETSLAESVKEIFLPVDLELSSLSTPVPIPVSEESTPKEKEPKAVTQTDKNPQPSPQRGCFREEDGEAQVLEKREWKNFSPAGEDIMVDLPDNVCRSASGYIAASDGVMYTISSMARPPISLEPAVVDGVLNTLARTFVGFRSRIWLGSPGQSFELKLARKEDVNGQPRKVYAYALISCSQRKDGMLIVQASKAHYYTIDISGTNESNPRVERFLKSLKFK